MSRTEDERASGAAPGEPVGFEIDPRRFVWRLAVVCVLVELGLVLFDYYFNYAGVNIVGPIRRLANLAREDSLANLVGVIQMFLVGLTTWGVALTVRRSRAAGAAWRGWVVVAILFTYMAIDDGASIHERIGTAVKQMLDGWAHSGGGGGFAESFPSYTWQLVFLPLYGAWGLYTVIFLWRELKPVRLRWVMVGGFACLAVAVLLDFIEGLGESHRYSPYGWIADALPIGDFARRHFHETAINTVRHFSKDLEETLETFGGTLLWVAVLRHWLESVAGFRIRLRRG